MGTTSPKSLIVLSTADSTERDGLPLHRPPPKFGAWDLFQLGQKHIYLSTVNDNVEAQRHFRRALELDPTLAAAYAWLSYAIVLGMLYFEGEPGEERLNEAVALARRGVELE